MTTEAQRIAIAQACGWLVTDDGSNNYKIMGSRHGWKQGFKPEPIPDYLNDLNACHEFEKVLTDEQWCAYSPTLWLITHRPPSTYECHATAPQRCEAFLKTIGKWTNDN